MTVDNLDSAHSILLAVLLLIAGLWSLSRHKFH